MLKSYGLLLDLSGKSKPFSWELFIFACIKYKNYGTTFGRKNASTCFR